MKDKVYIFAGYLRFLDPDKCEQGRVAEVISKYSEGWEDKSDIPIYYALNEDGSIKRNS